MTTTPQACSREVEIVNPQGLHARPVMQFVDIASQYASTVTVAKGDQVVDGKSPMDMIVLEGTRGTKLVISAHGADAAAAVEALADLVGRGFDEM